MPRRNSEFWLGKIQDNRLRDKKKITALEELGLFVVVIWECETRDPSVLRRRIGRLLSRLDARKKPKRKL